MSNAQHTPRRFGRLGKRLSGLAAAAAIAAVGALAATPPAEAATFQYQFFPDKTDPITQGWNQVTGDSNNFSVTSNPDALVVEDDEASNSGAQVPFFDDANAAGTISNTQSYQVRARLQMTDWDNINENEERGGFVVFVDDSSKRIGFNVRLDENDTNGNNDTTEQVVGLDQNGATPLDGVSEAFIGSGQFIDIVVDYDGDAAGTDNVTLTVNGSAIAAVSYADLPDLPSSPNRLAWGGGSSPTTSTTLLQGLSFGLDEDAPAIIPEPATFALLGLGGLVMAGGRRRRVD